MGGDSAIRKTQLGIIWFVNLVTEMTVDLGLEGNGVQELVIDDCSDGRQRKRENRRSLGTKTNAKKGEHKFWDKKIGIGRIRDNEVDPEIKEA